MRVDQRDSRQSRGGSTYWTAWALVVITYLFARDPKVSDAEMSAAAARFAFEPYAIKTAGHSAEEMATTRKVHPRLKRIQAWVSATGAAVTLADIDGDGLYNDMVLADPRVNGIVVQPVPGTGPRFEPRELVPMGLQFNRKTMSPTGSLVGDFDEDGFVDILVHYWGRTPILFQGRREGSLVVAHHRFVPVELIQTSGEPQRWFTHAATRADIDGDGHLDLLIGNFFQEGAEVLDENASGDAWVMHAGKSNARNGGGVKLLLWTPSNQRSAGEAIFEDHSKVVEDLCGRGWVLALGAADLDPDATEWEGLPEIYIAHDFGPDRLLHNRSVPGHPAFVLCDGDRHFTTPKSFVLGHDSYKGMGLDFADVNGDGLLDIYVSNIAEDYALHEGHFVFVSTGETQRFLEGKAPYEQKSNALGLIRGGWGWDCRFADMDNDSSLEALQANGFVKGTINRWPELHALGTTNDRLVSNPNFWPRFIPPTADLSGHNPNSFYTQVSSGRYVNIAAPLRMAEPLNSRGIAIADVDGDGWQDFVVANQWQDSTYFHNRSGDQVRSAGNSFVGLHLILPDADDTVPLEARAELPDSGRGGRPAIGAMASIRLPSGKSLVSYVDGGSGHAGRRSPTIHFGVGDEPPSALDVELAWRDHDGRPSRGVVQVTPGKWHTIYLGKQGAK